MAELNYRQLQSAIRDKFKGNKQALKELNIKLNAPKNDLVRVYQTYQNQVIISQYQQLQNQAKELGYKGRKMTKENLQNWIRNKVEEPVVRARQQQEFLQSVQQRKQRELLQSELRNKLQYVDQLRNLNVENFNFLSSQGYKFSKTEITKLFRNLGNDKYVLYVTYVDPITGEEKEKILTLRNDDKEALTRNYYSVEDGGIYSDEWAGVEYYPIVQYKLEKKVNKRMTDHRKQSGFFPYLNTCPFVDLSKYQIFRKNESRNDMACLIHVLEHAGIEKDIIQNVLLQIGHGAINTPISKMKLVAELIKRKIVMYYYLEAYDKNEKLSWGQGEELHIAQFKNHFFIFEKTTYTKQYIERMAEVEEKYPNHPNKTLLNRFDKKSAYSQKPVSTITSLQLITLMYKLGHFVDLDIYNVKINEIEIKPTLNNIDQDVRIFNYLYHNESKSQLIMYADCESDVTCNIHNAICFGVRCNRIYKAITRLNQDGYEISADRQFAIQIMKVIKEIIEDNQISIGTKEKPQDKIIIYFHNLKYDSSLFRNFYEIGQCVKDGQVYSKTYKMYGYMVECRDSFKHIAQALSKFPKMFDLPISKKEAIAYRFHTIHNIKDDSLVCIKKYMKLLKPEDHSIFMENMKDPEFQFNGTHFNANKYYLHYLKYDVDVLALGFEKYAKLMYDITGINVHEKLTISSVGDTFAKMNGCYNGACEVSKGTRLFIQDAVKGGRVYAHPDYVKKEIDEEIEDFDGVSLYPSAMKRLCEEYGIPLGKPKNFKFNDDCDWRSMDYYIVKIKITSIGKKQMIPSISYRDGNSIKYVNELKEDLITTIDKITLEDYIKFHKITFEMIEGIYWNEGFNKNLGTLIQKLHDERCLHKKNNKPMADCLKLIMNSIYGKTGQKISDEKTLYVRQEIEDQYIYDHFSLIKSIEKTLYDTKITTRFADESYSLNYVAVMILSMSKRIMNEVFDIMNTNQLQVFYTDTDSIHMLKKDVEPLAEAYRKEYNRELVGENLGQFHTDFSMENCKDVYSIKHIPLGSKCYMDLLTGTDEVTLEQKQDVHIRMKGINERAFKHEVEKRIQKKDGLTSIQATIEIYQDLAKGDSIEFIMNANELDASFEFGSFGVKSREVGKFKRVIKFLENKK